MKVWLFQIEAVELVYRRAVIREIRRIDPCGMSEKSVVKCVCGRVAAWRVRFRLVTRLEYASACIDANVIQLTALGCLELHLRRTAIVALLNNLERHGAGYDGQIQADCKQKGTDPALAERSPETCKSLNHPAFLAL